MENQHSREPFRNRVGVDTTFAQSILNVLVKRVSELGFRA